MEEHNCTTCEAASGECSVDCEKDEVKKPEEKKSEEVLIKNFAKRSCRKCHGTGVVGRVVTMASKGKKSVVGSGQGSIILCQCVLKNDKFKEAVKKVQVSLQDKLRKINEKKGDVANG